MKSITIKLKLTALITFLVIIIMFLVGLISLTREERNIKDQIKFQGYSLAKTLSISSFEPLLQHNLTMLSNYVTNIYNINLSNLIEIQDETLSVKHSLPGSIVNYVFLTDEFDNALVHSNSYLAGKRFINIQKENEVNPTESIVSYINHKAFLLVPENMRVSSINDLKDRKLYVINVYNELNYIFPHRFLEYFNINDNVFNEVVFAEFSDDLFDRALDEKAVVGVSIYSDENFNYPGFRQFNLIRNIDIMDFSVPITAYDDNNIGIVRLGISLDNMKSQIRRAQLNTISLTILGMILGMIGASIMARRISNPLRNLLNVVTKISQGILEERVFINTGDEVETLANGINLMSIELSKIVMNINSSANELSGTSDVLLSTAKDSKDYIEEIKQKINDINNGVVITTESVDKAVSAMNRLTASANNIFSNSTDAADFSQQSKDKANEGMNLVKSFNYKMIDIKSAFNQIQQMVHDLSKSISKIEEITTLITRITKKTNTLAYNVNLASLKSEGKKEVIEEISSQVRILSNDIEEAALNIFNIIEETKLDMKKVSNAVQSGYDKVEEGTKSSEGANKSLVEIVGIVSNVKEMIDKITELSQQQSNNVQAGTKDIKSISNVTNKTAFEVKGILKNIEEQVNLINITLLKGNELFVLAERLKKYVKFFSKKSL